MALSRRDNVWLASTIPPIGKGCVLGFRPCLASCTTEEEEEAASAAVADIPVDYLPNGVHLEYACGKRLPHPPPLRKTRPAWFRLLNGIYFDEKASEQQLQLELNAMF